MKMNEKGNLLLIILLAFVMVLIIPYVTLKVVPEAAFLAKIFMVFTIYAMVRGYLGGGILTLIISAILIYILVWKYGDAWFSLYVFSLLLGLGASQLIIFGISHSPLAALGEKR